MAIDYYQWDASGTSASNDIVYRLDGGAAGTSSSTTYFTVHYQVIYVMTRWSKATAIRFGRLTHEVPGFGWKVQAIIDGDITIMDPSVEVRALAEFLPLLRRSSSPEANAALDAFMRDNPEAPQ